MAPSNQLHPLGRTLWAVLLFLGSVWVAVRALMNSRITVLVLPYRRYVQRHVTPMLFWLLLSADAALGLIGLYFAMDAFGAVHAGYHG